MRDTARERALARPFACEGCGFRGRVEDAMHVAGAGEELDMACPGCGEKGGRL